MARRNQGVDLARALLILYVITVIHGLFWLSPFKGALRGLLLFEMPGIFLVSGYAFSLSMRGGQQVETLADYLRFAASRATRVLLPYVFYCLCCALLVSLHAALTPGSRIDPVDVFVDWVLTRNVAPEHRFGMLDNHLWFVVPFLVITLVLPLVTSLRLPAALRRAPLWTWLLGLAAVLAAIEAVKPPAAGTLDAVVFYLGWAVLGYAMDGRMRLDAKQTVPCVLLAACALGAAALWMPQRLDMQEQKFPPTWVFLAFSTLWIALLLALARRTGTAMVDRLAGSAWLRPFMKYSYSIYLWQGMGYTAAALLLTYLPPRMQMWWLALPVAVLLSVALGALASPLERIRVGKAPARARAGGTEVPGRTASP